MLPPSLNTRRQTPSSSSFSSSATSAVRPANAAFAISRASFTSIEDTPSVQSLQALPGLFDLAVDDRHRRLHHLVDRAIMLVGPLFESAAVLDEIVVHVPELLQRLLP